MPIKDIFDIIFKEQMNTRRNLNKMKEEKGLLEGWRQTLQEDMENDVLLSHN